MPTFHPKVKWQIRSFHLFELLHLKRELLSRPPLVIATTSPSARTSYYMPKSSQAGSTKPKGSNKGSTERAPSYTGKGGLEEILRKAEDAHIRRLALVGGPSYVVPSIEVPPNVNEDEGSSSRRPWSPSPPDGTIDSLPSSPLPARSSPGPQSPNSMFKQFMEDAETLSRMSPGCAELLVTATSDHSLLNNDPDHFVTSNTQLRPHLRRILGSDTRATVAEHEVDQSPLASGGVSLPESAASLSMPMPHPDMLVDDAPWSPDNIGTSNQPETTDDPRVDLHLMSESPSLMVPSSRSPSFLDLDDLIYTPRGDFDLDCEASAENDTLLNEFCQQ